MNTHSEKLNENQKNNLTEQVAPEKTQAATSGIVDNRPSTVMQRKLQEMADNSPRVKQLRTVQEVTNQKPAIQEKENTTGLPDDLKSGIETLSDFSMDDVKVHYNSDKPAQLQAHAYAQGTDIHIASGQEKYLPHEAWHVVQQKQGRVKPTVQMKANLSINDNEALESEADAMGANALSAGKNGESNNLSKKATSNTNAPIQRFVYNKVDSDWVMLDKKDAPVILIKTLNELKGTYPKDKDIIENIFDSDEHKILLYNATDVSAIKSEVAALIARVNQAPEEEKSKKNGNAWRTGRANKEFKAAAKEDKDGFDTGHHKLAKSKIQWLYDLLTKDQKDDLIKRLDLPSNSGVNALKSLYSNLTFGPGSGNRDDDPNKNLDANFHTPPKLQRTMTPRSLQYNNLDKYIEQIGGPPKISPDKKSISADEFKVIAGLFEKAEKLHAIITKGGGLDKNKSMWTKGELDWSKRDLPEPINLPDDLEEQLTQSVRDLKSAKNRSVEEGFSLTQEDRERLIEQLKPAQQRILKALEKEPNNVNLILWKGLIMHEMMDLMSMKR